MPYPSRRAALLAVALMLPVASAGAQERSPDAILVERAWTRAVGATAPTAAGYMTVTNRGGTPDRLVSARSPMARSVEIHDSSVADGVMRMRPLPDGVALPPGATLRLAPGGLHLMLIAPTGGFTRGGRVPVTLSFDRAGDVTVELEVAAAGARDAPGGHGGH